MTGGFHDTCCDADAHEEGTSAVRDAADPVGPASGETAVAKQLSRADFPVAFDHPPSTIITTVHMDDRTDDGPTSVRTNHGTTSEGFNYQTYICGQVFLPAHDVAWLAID